MQTKRSMIQMACGCALSAGVLMAYAAPAGAATLISENFSDSALGPIPAATSWQNNTGHEFGPGPGFVSDRHLAFTYDNDNNPATDEVAIPGGYEVNGFKTVGEEGVNYPATLTITVQMPTLLDPLTPASLSFWATGRDGTGTAANSTVSIVDATDNAVVVAPTTPTFNAALTSDGRPQWQFNDITYTQLPSYAGHTFEVIFTGGGDAVTSGSSATGLVLADLNFTAPEVVPEPASLSLLGLGGLALLGRRRRA
jgi:hypothetical protein